jgi:F-type H+-transporting ATPase subunit b
VSPTLTTFLFELVNFLALAALLGWLLFKPVRAALEARQAEEQQRRKTLEAQEGALAEQRSQLEAQREAFENETARLRKERLARAEAEAAAIIARAKDTADRDVNRGKRMLEHLDRAQMERLSAAVASTSRDAVARLLTTLHTPDIDQALLRAVCRQLEQHDGSLGAVVVESAAALGDAERAALVTAAGGRAASMEFRVVSSLGAGLRLTTARGLVDGSASGIAAHAERVLSAALADSGTSE